METIRACAEGEERFRFGAQNADFKNSPDVYPSSLRFYRLADADLRRIYSALEELSFRLFVYQPFLPTCRRFDSRPKKKNYGRFKLFSANILTPGYGSLY